MYLRRKEESVKSEKALSKKRSVNRYNKQFIGQRLFARRTRRMSVWYLVAPEEERRYRMEIVERTRIIPNQKSTISITMRDNKTYVANYRRVKTSRRIPKRRHNKVSSRERFVRVQRKRIEWSNRARNSGIELSTESEEEFSGDDLRKQCPPSDRKYDYSDDDECWCVRKLRKNEMTGKLKPIGLAFMNETSLHGIKQTWQGSPLRRLFYLCLVLSMACFLTYVLIETFVDYRRFPYNQQYTASINNELNFPGVTVCNINNNRFEKHMHEMGNWTAEDYYNKYYDSLHIMRCSFSQRNCTGGWLKKFISIRGEENLCLVFNLVLDGAKQENFKISKLGILNGLSVVFALKPQEDEEVSYGVTVYLHEPSLLPTEYEATFVAAPGYSTYAIINPEKMTVLGNPYRSEVCIESPPYGYNLAQCERNCAYKYVESQCKCQLPFTTNYLLRKCLVKELPCIKKEHGIFLANRELLKKCKCLRRCSSIVYHTQISTAYRPRNNSLPDHLEMNMYYQTLVMKEVKEVPKYSLDKIISQFGGQMGIFLGSSIVTVCEIVEVVLKLTLQTVHQVCSKRRFSHRRIRQYLLNRIYYEG